MARPEIEVKFVGLEEFLESVKEVREAINDLNKTIESLPWYVRIIIAIKTTLQIKDEPEEKINSPRASELHKKKMHVRPEPKTKPPTER